MDSINGFARWAKEGLHARQSTPGEVFSHTRLDTAPGTSFIRLLKIQEDSDNSIIRVQLEHVDLNSTSPPIYEAASYSWRRDILRDHDTLSEWFPDKFPLYGKEDSNAGTKFIFCNGKHLQIQGNLYDFLVRLRAKKRGLPIWIDAICIDQDEKDEAAREEKFRQLEMMGKIYESAQAVLVWLGENGNISSSFDRSLKQLEQMHIKYEPYQTEYDIWKIHEKKKPYKIIGKLDGMFIASLTRLLNRDYFQRAWVVQELILAQELVFFLGPFELPPEKLLNGIYVIMACGLFPFGRVVDLADMTGSGFRAMPHMLKAQKDRKEGKHMSFSDFLFLTRDREATRPEDKVFSVLGLINAERRSRLTDGVMTKDGVLLNRIYANCATDLAKDHGWPYVLSLIATGAAETQDLPSWVPDQRVPLKPKPFWYYGCTHFKAATSVRGEFVVTEYGELSQQQIPRSLSLQVAYIDEIVQVGESHAEMVVSQIKYSKGHIVDLITKLGKFYAGTDELSMDAVMRTFTADIFERDGRIPIQKLRFAFLGWFGTTIRNIRFKHSDTRNPEDSFRKNTAQGRFAIALHNTSDINGTPIRFSEALDEFVKVHECPEYPWAKRLGNPPPNILVGEELVGVPEVEAYEDEDDKKRRRLVNEFESETANHFWRFKKQQIGSLAWAMNEIYQSRRIFRTKGRNMVGAGPRDIKIGDIVCLVGGTDTPFIFRRTTKPSSSNSGMDSSKIGSDRIVGSAYLHGAMYGELVGDAETKFETLQII